MDAVVRSPSRSATMARASTQDIFDRLGDPFVTTRPGYGEETRRNGPA